MNIALCYVRSNIWPGAFTLGHTGCVVSELNDLSYKNLVRLFFRNYFNLYVGWGQKYEQFNPSQPPLPEAEFTQEFIEKNDPSVEHENAVEEARRVDASEFTSEEYTSEEEDNEEQLTDEED